MRDDYIKKACNPKLELKQYDIILLNLSVHYSFKYNCGFLNLMREINKRTKHTTNLMISFINKDILFKDTDLIKFNDSGFMKKLDNCDGYSKMKYYYPWRHKKPLIEPILSRSDLETYLNSLGWYVKNEYHNMYSYNEMGYKELADSITRLVFRKLNF